MAQQKNTANYFEVPVSNHTKKYLLIKFNCDEVLYLDNKNYVGVFLRTLLLSPGAGRPVHSNPDYLKVTFSSHENSLKKWCISKDQASVFDNYIDSIIREEFMQYVSSRNAAGNMHVDKLIREFKLIYSLDEDDWSFSAMKRYYYRNYENKLNKFSEIKNKVSAILSPKLSLT